jgi:hypothetical protein
MIKSKPIRQKATRKSNKAAPTGAGASGSKLSRLETMLRRAEGATLPQLIEALQWQAHSIRGSMSGSLKKKRGLKIEATKVDGQDRVYRIME